MPLYQYLCPICTNRFDARSTVEERDCLQSCPTCGGEGSRQFNPRSVGFKIHYDPDGIHKGTSFELTKNESYDLAIGHNTSTKSTNYLLNKKRAERQNRFDEAFSKKKPHKTIEQRMKEKYPDMQQGGTVSAKVLNTTLSKEVKSCQI